MSTALKPVCHCHLVSAARMIRSLLLLRWTCHFLSRLSCCTSWSIQTTSQLPARCFPTFTSCSLLDTFVVGLDGCVKRNSPGRTRSFSHTRRLVSTDHDRHGAGVLLTTDYALKNRYRLNLEHINRRFLRMTRQLKPPYRDATLPTILTPEELLDSFFD